MSNLRDQSVVYQELRDHAISLLSKARAGVQHGVEELEQLLHKVEQVGEHALGITVVSDTNAADAAAQVRIEPDDQPHAGGAASSAEAKPEQPTQADQAPGQSGATEAAAGGAAQG